jgi:3-dehydroquinate synthase
MINTMSMDKKVLDGRLRLVVCRGIGDAFLSDEVAASTLAATLKAGAALYER